MVKSRRSRSVKFEYDPKTDAAYLRLERGKVVESEEVQPGLVLDIDTADRVVVGVGILRFAKRFMSQTKPPKKFAG